MKILIIDDHVAVRGGLRQIFMRQASVKILEAATGDQGLEQDELHKPDVILLDVNLDGESGLDVLARLFAKNPSAKILMFTATDDPSVCWRALQAGALGYVTKGCPIQVLIMGIDQVSRGSRYIEPGIASKAAIFGTAADASQWTLTDREEEILRLLGEGMSFDRIASQLGVADKTIANTCARIKDKLNLARTSDLLVHAMRQRRL